MAITILDQCEDYTPSYNEMFFVVDSTNKTNYKFKYLCDIYVNSTLIHRVKQFPAPVTGYSTFKVGRVLENYLSYTLLSSTASIFNNDSNGIVTYQIKFGEEYDTSTDGDGDTTLFTNLTLTSSKYCWNGVLQYDGFYNYSPNTFLMSGSSSQFLTNSPSTLTIKDTQRNYLSYLSSGTPSVDGVRIRTYNDSTLNGEYYFNKSGSVTTKKVLMNLDLSTINGLTPSYTIVGLTSSGVITDNVNEFKIDLLHYGSTSSISEIKTFKIDRCTSPYQSFNFVWLNTLGGWDSYVFDKESKRTVNTNKTEFKKIIGRTSGGSWGYSIGDRGRTVLSAELKQKYKVSSDWCTDEDSDYLEGLYTNPETYLYMNSSLYPIITFGDYEDKYILKDKLFNFDIEFEFAYDKKVQRS